MALYPRRYSYIFITTAVRAEEQKMAAINGTGMFA
jgi:hypothetical protein